MEVRCWRSLLPCPMENILLPPGNFTAKELVWATNNYQERIGHNPYGGMFKGYLERHQIVLKWKNLTNYSLKNLNAAACDKAIPSLMSHLKNVLKLTGCCLEFEFPALVYEYVGSTLLTDFFRGCNSNGVLSWRSSIKIVSGIASLIVCTAFPTPIIHRNLNPFNLIIDQYGAANLFDFSFAGAANLFDFSYAIALPPGKSRVEDDVFGTFGLLDPEYYESSIVKGRTDVYSFGVLLLMLLTGKRNFCENNEGEIVTILQYIQENVHGNQLDKS